MDMDALKNWKEWLELLFPLLVFLGLYLFRHLKSYGKANQLRQVAPMINGEVKIRPFSAPRIQGSYMGLPYRISFHEGGRGQPGRMLMRIDFPGTFRMTLTPRGKGSAIEELFARGRTIDTAEDSFNQAVLVRVESEKDKALVYLDNPMSRGVILDLLQAGFVSIRFTGKGIQLIKPGEFLEQGGFAAESVASDLDLACRLMR